MKKVKKALSIISVIVASVIFQSIMIYATDGTINWGYEGTYLFSNNSNTKQRIYMYENSTWVRNVIYLKNGSVNILLTTDSTPASRSIGWGEFSIVYDNTNSDECWCSDLDDQLVYYLDGPVILHSNNVTLGLSGVTITYNTYPYVKP